MASQSEETANSGTSKTEGASDEQRTRSGVCKWFNVLKGWGFITPDDGGQEVFVHQSVIHMLGFRSLGEGERVEFQSHQTERGEEATLVTGPSQSDCKGSSVRPLGKKKYKRIRCFNCGQFGNHVAAKCRMGQLPKSCYHCKATDHLISDCPHRKAQGTEASASSLVDTTAALTLQTPEESKEEENSNHVVGQASGSSTKSVEPKSES